MSVMSYLSALIAGALYLVHIPECCLQFGRARCASRICHESGYDFANRVEEPVLFIF